MRSFVMRKFIDERLTDAPPRFGMGDGCLSWVNSYTNVPLIRQRSSALRAGRNFCEALDPGAWSLRDPRTLANVVRPTGRRGNDSSSAEKHDYKTKRPGRFRGINVQS